MVLSNAYVSMLHVKKNSQGSVMFTSSYMDDLIFTGDD